MLNITSKRKLSTASFLVLMISTSLSFAQPGGRGRPQGPPPEAIEACADLSEGDACSFSGRRGDELTGTCMTPPKGDDGLACAPEGGPPDKRERPE